MHESTFKIRTFHTDAFGHVNNARHLEILEEARWQYAEDIGLMPLLRQEELGFIIMDMRVRFREPVFEGDQVKVSTALVTLGSASGEVKQLMHKEERAALTSLFHFILVRREDGKSVPIEGAIRKCLLSVIED
jgi:thioesterase-3